ncbi:MAG: sodium-translocating pyrophosphatase [Candidatus Wallbacteria bacterium HGW-Wallbacteria-1]|uniref:Putative K(+)-stimulated pyrophosphate-energized sodium pump n=1 Tax=Candidatus Wallbacteria bacterium HGW-Wallbacteria-1 TaxID=2013854 RepID=A0A2N1PSP6_9BACT|nr:MAG: sodium-translocating pyrophosphatase [Candidatus Wallbacteria bacterium HGW-Wallbacteria-1]
MDLKRVINGASLGLAILFCGGLVEAAEKCGSPAWAKPETLFWIGPLASVLALVFAFVFYKKLMKESEGTDKMKEIAAHVREGAYAYLFAQYRVVGIVFLILLAIFVVLAWIGVQNRFVPMAFLTGGFFSGLCGFIGMKTATNASARTAHAATTSLNSGLQVAFRSGAVMGLVVVGLGLIDISAWYLFLDRIAYAMTNGVTQGFSFLGIEFVKPGLDEARKFVEITTTMLTFGMGASTQALFARVGGGIYTKAADVGADLVGKVEAGIPEDDPRNPATIADNVGDNVGDVAGMGADLYESYCGSILATAALGAAIPASAGGGVNLVLAPIIVAGIGIILSIFGIFLVKCDERADMKTLLKALGRGVWVSSLLIILAVVGLAYVNMITWGIVGSVVAGVLAGVIIGQLTEYYTSDEYAPTQGIAEQAKMGPATTIIDGIAVGMFSTGWPVVTIVFGILAAFGFAGGFRDFAMGLYGVGFAAVGMLATLGITLATDAYGPIADNAGGNAEMSGLGPEVRERTDALDMLGNTTAATGKGFAIGSAALTAMALMAAYLEEVRIWLGNMAAAIDVKTGLAANFVDVGSVRFINQAYEGPLKVEHVDRVVALAKASMLDFSAAYDLSVMNPKLLCGIFLGAMMAFVFCAMTMKAVGRAAGSMVEEVRRQFREIPGIMEGTGKPDYARCVEISTKGAQREMITPSLMAIIIPVVTGLILGVSGVIGLLVGGLTTGFVLACMLNNSGGAWDNAKKHIEKQPKTYAADDKEKKFPLTGKGSEAHKAGVVGDTVGDPFKDTSGPSLNILIKLMTMVSVVFSGVVVRYGDQIMNLIDKMGK